MGDLIFAPHMLPLMRQGKITLLCEYQRRFVEGKSIAVQPGFGLPAAFRITVTNVREMFLKDVGLRDVRRNGFRTTKEFVENWGRWYKNAPDLWVQLVSFELGDTTDKPRLLAARPGPPGGDYTAEPRLAAQGEPEAVSESEQAHYSMLGNARYAARGCDPLLRERDEMRMSLERMRAALSQRPNKSVEQTVRRLDAELRTLDRKIREAA